MSSSADFSLSHSAAYIPPFMSSVNIQYTKERAAASWNKWGEKIPEGKVEERLKLGQLDTRVHVRALICESIIDKVMAEAKRIFGLYAQLDETTYVNLNSICKRLHVEKQEVKEAIQKGRLHPFLLDNAQRTSKVLDAFEEIMQKVDPYLTKSLSKQEWITEIRSIIKNRHRTPFRYTPLNLQGRLYYLGFDPFTQKISLRDLESTKIVNVKNLFS